MLSCQQKRAARLPSAAPGSIEGGGPETRSGTVQSLKCCPCQQKRAARLKSAAAGSMKGGGPETRSGTVQSLKCCPVSRNEPRGSPGSIKGAGPSAAPGSIRGGPRNALGYLPEPEVLPLPAETSREAQKCCAWQHRGGGPLKCCPCQQKRAARLKSAMFGSIKGGGPETRSGTVQSLKCCPCQQKRAARLKSAAPGIKGGGPETREVLPLPAETSPQVLRRAARLKSAAPGSIKGGGPRNALGYRPEPEAPASRNEPRGSRAAPRSITRGGPETRSVCLECVRGPETRSGTVQSLKCCPCQQKRAWQHQGAPKRARAPSRA